MILRHLACLLILLIATQSAIAVADAHKLHQSGFEHLKFDHSHSPFDNTDYSIAKQLSDLPSQSSDDCHHCCHCHGSMVLIEADSQLVAQFSGLHQSDYKSNLFSGIPPALYRPPII